jgi:hypothetical protein
VIYLGKDSYTTLIIRNLPLLYKWTIETFLSSMQKIQVFPLTVTLLDAPLVHWRDLLSLIQIDKQPKTPLDSNNNLLILVLAGIQYNGQVLCLLQW